MKKAIFLMMTTLINFCAMSQSRELNHIVSDYSFSNCLNEKQYEEVKKKIEEKFNQPDLIKNDSILWVKHGNKENLNIRLIGNRINIQYSSSKNHSPMEDDIKEVLLFLKKKLDNDKGHNYDYDSF